MLVVAVLVVYLAAKSWMRMPSELDQLASRVGKQAVQNVSPASTKSIGLNSDLFRQATLVHGEMAARELESERLIAIIRAALSSDDTALWAQVSQNELKSLIQINPLAAAGLAQSLAPGNIREQMFREIAQGWAAQDATGALAWADSMSDAGERKSALGDVCLQLSQSNPAAALNATRQYGLADEGGLLENIVQQSAAKDATTTYNWVAQLPACAERDALTARVAFVESQVSPSTAAGWVVNQIPPGSIQDEAAISVLHQWGLLDFAGATAWAAQFPSGPLGDRAKQELAGIAEYRQSPNN